MNPEEAKWLFTALRKINFFSALSMGDIEELIEKFEKYNYPRGKVILREKKTGEAFFIIYKGKVAVTQKVSFFKKKFLKELPAGSFFGEISLISNEPTTATVTAKEPCEVFILLKSDFLKILKQNPKLEDDIRFVAEKRQFEQTM